ncbi:MAG TPA: hypothetical protein VF552_00575 [Allosphingosinicella sp.]|jgi:hypothetical protein
MKSKRTFVAAIAAVAGTWIMPVPASADPTPYSFTYCDDSTCTVYECSTYPNLNDGDWEAYGCSPSLTYPRPREVSGG